MSVFTWWVSKAVVKYWSQPLSTEISYSFGDNENGIQFPLITFCESDFYRNNPILSKYLNESIMFMPTLRYCMENDDNFKIDNFMSSLKISREHVISLTEFWTGSEYVDSPHLDDFIWFTGVFF